MTLHDNRCAATMHIIDRMPNRTDTTTGSWSTHRLQRLGGAAAVALLAAGCSSSGGGSSHSATVTKVTAAQIKSASNSPDVQVPAGRWAVVERGKDGAIGPHKASQTASGRQLTRSRRPVSTVHALEYLRGR